MAHQRQLPFLVFKTPEVTLQGIAARNLSIDIRPDMPNGRPVFRCRRELLHAALDDLKARALKNRKAKSRADLLANVGKLSTFVVGTYAFGSFVDWLSRPNCFGNFYYRAPECKTCSYKPACKVEKARQQA